MNFNIYLMNYIIFYYLFNELHIFYFEENKLHIFFTTLQRYGSNYFINRFHILFVLSYTNYYVKHYVIVNHTLVLT